MYIRTRLGFGSIIDGSDLMRMRAGQVKCTAYVTGERRISHTPKGHLSPDVSLLNGRLLIADFGVSSSWVKSTTKMEKLLKDWLNRFETDPTYRLRILGYSDCVRIDKANQLRQNRAQQVFQLLGKSARPRVVSVVAAPLGTYVPGTDNTTVEGRAKNRGVVIEFWQENKFAQPGSRIPSPSDVARKKEPLRPEETIEERVQRALKTKVPTLHQGKSLAEWLGEVLAGVSGSRKLRDAILNGGCALLEGLFRQRGGTLSEKQKEEFRKQCLEGAKRPVR
jgi:hypothetical protein